jgi:large subunit ribosomal protein L24
MSKVRKNDQVKMIAGKDRGKTGKVIRVMPKDNKAVIEGLNLVKKHSRPRRQGEKGQRVSIPAAVDISNFMLICPKCSRTARIGYKISGDNKFRVCKKCNSEI